MEVSAACRSDWVARRFRVGRGRAVVRLDERHVSVAAGETGESSASAARVVHAVYTQQINAIAVDDPDEVPSGLQLRLGLIPSWVCVEARAFVFGPSTRPCPKSISYECTEGAGRRMTRARSTAARPASKGLPDFCSYYLSRAQSRTMRNRPGSTHGGPVRLVHSGGSHGGG